MPVKNISKFRVLFLSFFVFLILILVWWCAGHWYESRLIDEKRVEVSNSINISGNSLRNAINQRFALIRGLQAFIVIEVNLKHSLGKDGFEKFASGLHAGTKGIRAIQALPEGVVRFIYPMAGNEKALGHDLLHDPRPAIREDVQRTLRTRQPALCDPYEMLQGGLGVIERLAVYKTDDTFWGLAVIVLDVQPLLDVAGITLPGSKVELSLRDKSQKVFYGREAVFLSGPVIYRIELPDGYWELAGIPEVGWKSSIQKPLWVFHGIGLVVVLMLTGIVYLIVSRQMSLAMAVQQRTSELNLELSERKEVEGKLFESERYNRMLFNQSPIGLALCRVDGRLIDVNPAYAAIIGRTVEETLTLTY